MSRKVILVVLAITLSITLLFTAVEIISFNEGHYREMFNKHNVPEETGMDMEELESVMNDLLLYLKDDRPLLNTTRIVNGEELPAFGERAVLHMIDVKALFVAGRRLRSVCIIVFITLLTYIIIKDKNWKSILPKMLVYTGLINIALVLVLYLLMMLDFYRYFTYFHLLFFTNDLWILEADELMILMLPEGFFNDTAVRIAVIFLGSNLFLTALGFKDFFVVRKLTGFIGRNNP